MKLNRRQLLQALGLGGAAAFIPRIHLARAGAPAAPPSRIIFYVQPHGHIPNAWKMDIPGSTADKFADRPLVDLAVDDLSPTLRPLYAYRDRLIAIEGLCHTAALADIAAVHAAGSGDDNNHQIGVADVLTGTRALQRTGAYCTGGARTIDQELAIRGAAPGRFDSRVYGYDYTPNSVASPFSYLDAGQSTPMVSDPKTAFADLLGYMPPPATSQSRDDVLRSLRPSVLDTVAREYDLLAPQLGAEGRQKLEQHRDLVRELEASLGAIGPAPKCDPTFDNSGNEVRQFMRLIRLAFACDLTRVVMFQAPVPQCPEIGYPADATIHGYAHQSIEGATSCGATYEPIAAQAMTVLDAWHAGHFAYLLEQLDSVIEGSGTLLDHTVVVWITELATPTHLHHNAFTVLAGGCNGFFKTGRYIRYPTLTTNPVADQPTIGPAHNKLLVSLMQAMGQPDTSYGMTDTVGSDGSAISMSGPLTELRG